MKTLFVALIMGLLLSEVRLEMLGRFVFDDKMNSESSISIIHTPRSLDFAPNPGPILSNEISSVLSLSLGLSIENDLKWSGLRGTGIFNNPKAVLMLSVEGMSKKQKFLHKKSLTSFPVKMMGEDIADIHKVAGTSLPAHINELFNNEALTQSVSFEEKIATSGFSTGKLSTTSFWNDFSNSWVTISGNSDMKNSMTNHNILKEMADFLPKQFVYNKEDKVITVNSKNVKTTFSIENAVDFNFISEVVYLLKQSKDTISNFREAIKDDVPDVYLFSISTLKKLEQHYGSDSKQVEAALLLLELVIPQMVQRFVDAYGGDILVVGVEVPSMYSLIETHKHAMINAVKSLKDQEMKHLKDLDSYIPELHVVAEMEKSAHKSLCDAIKGSIAHLTDFKFECSDDSKHIVAKRSLKADGSLGKLTPESLNLDSHYDDMFPVIFNIWFWLMVILFLAVYVISLSLWYMDPGRDSIIYRLTQQRIKSE